MTRTSRVWLGWAVAIAVGPLPLDAQAGPVQAERPDRITLVAGAHYRAGFLHRLLLGSHHRDLWTTPLEVAVLDLSRFANGLTPTGCGGRRQTKSLRFLGGDGQEYVFRSVDKDPTLALPLELRATFARAVIQDQISSAHPGGPLVVAPLLDAAGVLHAEPRLVVLPEDARLSGFSCVRAGMLGMIEERPVQPPDNEPAFAGAVDVAGTKKLFEHLEDDADHRIDARALLAARLMDVLIGDWDRHQDQWRWARFDSGGVHWWRPIPRDRDQAFARLDGILVWVAGFYQPQLVGFHDRYPSTWRLTLSGQVVDRRLLVDLERPVWDSTARALQSRLTDPVIDAAVRRLPPEYYRKNGAALLRALRLRRDRLPEIAGRFYSGLARTVEIHGTDKRDVAEVERLSGGRVTVRLKSREGGTTYHWRSFDRRETKEIRLYLHDGDDRLVVRGSDGSGPVLRVVGGAGDDDLTDSSRAGKTRLYDDRGNDRIRPGPGTSVDRSNYDPPPPDTATLGRPRDWGARWLPSMWVSYAPDIGLLAGAGVTRTGYGFRRVPYNSRVSLRAGYATAARTYRAELTGEFRGLMPPAVVVLQARASGIDVVRFYGFGNETVDTGSVDFYKVKQQQYLLAPTLQFAVSPAATLAIGPVFKSAQTQREPGTFIDSSRPYGSASFGQVGATAEFRLDTRDRPQAASRGLSLRLGGAVYPEALDVRSAFGEGHVEVASYVTARIPLAPTLAVRIAGKKVWGAYPLHEAAYVGGQSTVRGFPEHRFAGDAAVSGNVELRLAVARFYLLLPGEIGVFGLGDAGRVYLAGETSARWHAAAGGGLWFTFLNRANTVSVAAADGGEGMRVYVRAGFAY